MNNAEYSGRQVDRAGISPRSLLLLGGLAALALNADTRRRLVGGTRDLIDTAGHTLEDTVKPALATAADQAGHAAQVAVQKSAEAIGTLREEVPNRAHALLETVQEVAGNAAGTAASKAGELTREVRRDAVQVAGGASRQASRELHKARRTGRGLLSDVEERVTSLIGAGQDNLESHRRDAERQLGRARRDAEKELRSAHRSWDAAKLERAVEKRVAPLHKRTARELARLEKEARRGGSRGGLGGGTLILALLGTGAVVLARVPAARQGVLKAVEAVSPEAAERLHTVSRNARNVIGSVWLERIEEADQTPAPGAARTTQAGTTGAVWGGSPEAGSPAASSTTPTPEAQARAAQTGADQMGAEQTKAGQTKAEQAQAPQGQTGPAQGKPESSSGNKSN